MNPRRPGGLATWPSNALTRKQSEHDVVEKATHEKPLLIILDLNNNSVEPLPLISKLKDDGTLKNISIIGYLPHVQGELKQKAHEAGANIAMARSAFSPT